MSTEIIAAIVAGMLAIAGSILMFVLESRRRKREQEASGAYTSGNDSAEGLWKNIGSIYTNANRWVDSKIAIVADPEARRRYESLPRNDYAEIVRQMLAAGHMDRQDGEKFLRLVTKFRSLRRGTATITHLEEMRHMAAELGLPT